MDLSDAEKGDLVIFSDGSQALISNVYRAGQEKLIVEFNIEVAGWINNDRRYSWCYNNDGSFSILPGDKNAPHVDIVKVVHNDQEDR